MDDQAPVMIVGIRPRCGTNFLCDLINLHRDIARPNPIDEDYFLAHAEKLELFSQALSGHWANLSRPVPKDSERQVLTAIGVGLLGWLTALTDGKRVLTKSPVPGRLDLFSDLFPMAKLLIIVRDGRAVVESHMRSWPEDGRFGDDLFAGLCRAWVDGAQTIQTFRSTHPVAQSPYMLVRYEDLVANVGDMMGRILEFVALDADSYDFNRAAALPVRGSSSFGRDVDEPLVWDPIEKNDTFDPLNRWAHWTDDRHALFNSIAGDAMAGFGYATKNVP